LNFTVGDIVGNTKKIAEKYREACFRGADLVVATELALFGYPPKDMLLQEEYLKRHEFCLGRLCAEIGETALVIGIVEKNEGDGKPLFNSAALIQNGKIIRSQRKILLPTYDVFDEARYFEAGVEKPSVFDYKGKKMAILICEDIWRGADGSRDGKLYRRNPVRELNGKNLDVVIVINSSPYSLGKGDMRFRLVSGVAKELGCAVVYANQVGGNDDLVFDGRSFAVNKKGECVGFSGAFAENATEFDVEKGGKIPYPSDKDSISDLYRALSLGTRDYVDKSGFSKALVALSGGIDSALVAAIAVEALGADRVVGVSMPSKYSSEGSVKDAESLAKNLGIEFHVIPIADVFSQYEKTFKDAGVPLGGVAEENIQARIRGNYIMYLSNTYNYVVLTTGNKSEISVGFCTLYGDTAGGFAVISDVYKTLVYELAKYVNGEREIIPLNTITKPPSAELRPDQVDEDYLPPYDILDGILKAYIEERRSLDDIVSLGFDEDTVKWVVSKVNRNEYKRRQMAPGVKITPTAFGSGRRLPIVAKFS